MDESNPEFYIDGVRAGNRRILAKTITLIESAHPTHRGLGRTVVDRILPHTGTAARLGITGVPGVGKSTFIESFGMMLVENGHRVAVLAVDPSSSRSGGSSSRATCQRQFTSPMAPIEMARIPPITSAATGSARCQK